MFDLIEGKDCIAKIPDAKYYVLSNDSFLSGWGSCEGKMNTCIVPCSSREEADSVIRYIQTRSEQKNIRKVCRKPRAKEGVAYSIVYGWLDRAKLMEAKR